MKPCHDFARIFGMNKEAVKKTAGFRTTGTAEAVGGKQQAEGRVTRA